MPIYDQKIIIIVQLILNIMRIEYCELLLACPGVLDHTHMKKLI